MIVTSWHKCIMITWSLLDSDVGPLSLEPSHQQGMQLRYETYSNRTWPFCQSNCILVSPGHRNDKLYSFLQNFHHKWHSFVHVDLRAAICSFPSSIAVHSSGRLFHDQLRNHVGPPAYSELCTKPVGMWNGLETGCPFSPKQWFKHNVLNTSCHVIDKDVDINPVLYQFEKKFYLFLTMCKQWHVSCKQQLMFFLVGGFGRQPLRLGRRPAIYTATQS